MLKIEIKFLGTKYHENYFLYTNFFQHCNIINHFYQTTTKIKLLDLSPSDITGLTNIMTSGAFRQSSAKATRAFCPPDRSFMRMVCAWPASPKVPSCLRAFSYGRSNNRIKYSAGVSSAVKCSPECWSNFPSFYKKYM